MMSTYMVYNDGYSMNMRTIFVWILALFVLYLTFELLRKLLGGSLGFEEITIGLLIANLGYSFYINSKLSEHMGWHKRKGEA